MKKDENWGLEENDGSEDVYTPFPEDWNYSLQTSKLTVNCHSCIIPENYYLCIDVLNCICLIWIGSHFQHKYMEEVIKKIKDSGNDYFEKQNFVDAGRKYKKALRYYLWMNKQQNMPDTFYASLVNLRLSLLLNLAAVNLKKKEYRKAIDFCNEVSKYPVRKLEKLHYALIRYLIQVLQADNMNSKALFRRGQAYTFLNEYKLGLKDFCQVFELCPSKTVLQEIKKVKKMDNFYLKLEKTACQKMFH